MNAAGPSGIRRPPANPPSRPPGLIPVARAPLPLMPALQEGAWAWQPGQRWRLGQGPDGYLRVEHNNWLDNGRRMLNDFLYQYGGGLRRQRRGRGLKKTKKTEKHVPRTSNRRREMAIGITAALAGVLAALAAQKGTALAKERYTESAQDRKRAAGRAGAAQLREVARWLKHPNVRSDADDL